MAQHSSRRILGSALESIMQEVLQGMKDFTREACVHGDTAAMEILAVGVSKADLMPAASGGEGESGRTQP